MPFLSLNPATEERLARHPTLSRRDALAALARGHAAFLAWRNEPIAQRLRPLRTLARLLRARRDALADLLTAEMGKPIGQSRAEVEKCAAGCEYFARQAAAFLAPRTPTGAPTEARVFFEPLGVVLAIMPWNFPFWQALRAAVPALVAGNAFLHKPAPNTAGCGLALQAAFDDAGFPRDLIQTLLIEPATVAALIDDPRVAGVTLTGSTTAGRAVAARAGAAMKPGVFELGGSDAYLVLADADLDHAAEVCVHARLINSGQSCIAAKRFIVARKVLPGFEARVVARMAAAPIGDPTDPDTAVGPLARADLRAHLYDQIVRSCRRGARLLLGGTLPAGRGFYYPPSVLTDVRPGTPASDEELFGPVAAIMAARDDTEAIAIANDSAYGLGAAVFSRSRPRALRVARQLQAGNIALNDFVRSDPALPFGGVKQSGHGRELGEWGLTSFVNVQTIVGLQG